MPRDPYQVLGVPRDAGDTEIRAAYERRIEGAARAGLLELAKAADAAYEVLRDPHRRARFDRDGVAEPLMREHPAQRWAPPRQVPFRSWAPMEPASAPSARCDRTRRGRRPGNALPLAVVAAVFAALWHVGLLRTPGATSPAGDVWSPRTASAQMPPVHLVANPHRVLPPVTGPPGQGGYQFANLAAGRPVRFDPCQTIHYVVNGSEPFPGAQQLLTSAIAEVSAATGLTFVSAGSSDETATSDRPLYQPARYGERWAPVLIAWTDPQAVPRLAGQVVGLGGGAAAEVDGQPRLVSGEVYFDTADLAAIRQRPDGSVLAETVMLHELGHLVGLGHVEDPTQVMFPTSEALGHYGDGDLRGLALLGQGPCFPES